MINDYTETEAACIMAIILSVLTPPEVDAQIFRNVADRLAYSLPPESRERVLAKAEEELDLLTIRMAEGVYGNIEPAHC